MNTPAIGPRIIAITSGKGGVGKTCLAANLGYALAKKGRRVLITDLDLGLANLDIILNLNPTATLHDVLRGTETLDKVILQGPGGMHILPSGSGMTDYSRMTSTLREGLPDILASLAPQYDYVLLDIGAGISDVVLYAASLAKEILVVATPEPTSLADAYATIKVLSVQQGRTTFSLVVNQVAKEHGGQALADQLQHVADRFIRDKLGRQVSLCYLGAVPSDPAVDQSILRRQLLLATTPTAPSAKAIDAVATRLDSTPPAASAGQTIPDRSVTGGKQISA